MLNQIFAACLFMAAESYAIPPEVLMGIQLVEGGKVGQQVGPNKNGTYDLGPMQINTLWVPELAKHWRVSDGLAKKWLRDDPCTNVNVAAWILRGHMNETRSMSQAIAHYHSRTPYYGTKYRSKVIAKMRQYNLKQYAQVKRAELIEAKQLAENTKVQEEEQKKSSFFSFGIKTAKAEPVATR